MTLNSKCAVSNVPIRKYFINKQSKQTSSNWICDQADAFARGVDPLLTVSISGDMAKAKNLASADEGQEEDFRTRMFKAHPLSVTLSIRTGKSEVGLLDEGIKNFTYWPRRGPILSHDNIPRPSPNKVLTHRERKGRGTAGRWKGIRERVWKGRVQGKGKVR